MELEDKFGAKASGVQSLSSSVQSTPEKNGNLDDASRSPEQLQKLMKRSSKKESVQSCFDKEKNHSNLSKTKMAEPSKTVSKMNKKQDSKKASFSPNNQPISKKQQRKGENPTRLLLSPEQPSDFARSKSWVCKNSACRAVLSIDDTFCKRCSCCICHLFDDNKDPSLWLVCTSENSQLDACGLSCHIDCALQREKVGIVDLGQLMQLDGSHCCASCGKVSGILGCWRKQLAIAKEARRVDILCYRIYLSYRLLEGTSRFKELYEIVKEAKTKLETEVGPLNGVSAKMARGIVSRLPVAGDVQKLCQLAIEKADEWLANTNNQNPNGKEGSLPAACRFLFEEVTSSSVVIFLVELPSESSEDIKGYKLWYWKSPEEEHAKDPISLIPRTQRRILVSNLQPCTEYTFRIISYTETTDLGHSEAKCFTKSIELINKKPSTSVSGKGERENALSRGSTSIGGDSSGFKVRDLGKVFQFGWAQESRCPEGICISDAEKLCAADMVLKPESQEDHLPDLNIVSVPDLNEELTPPFDSSRDEDNGCALERVADPYDDVVSNGTRKNGLTRSHGSGDSQTWTDAPNGDAIESCPGSCRKRSGHGSEEMHDSDSTLINGSPFRISSGSGCLDENFEYCVKIIRWLECEDHINSEFRLKLLTWFSLRSTEQERRIINTFIQTLIDDPSSLAGQLVDTFSDIISNKRPRNGFCGKLWH